MIGTLTRNTEPNQKWASSQPLATGPIAPAAPVTPAQMAIALVRSSGGNTLTRIDSVDGMMKRGADAHDGPAADELPHLGRPATRPGTRTRKMTRPNCSAPLRPKRSPSAPVGEQQPREHQRVDGDDPLQLRLGGAQVARQRRDGDVEAGVADEDDQQAQAQHGEDPPAAAVDELGGQRRGRRRSAGASRGSSEVVTSSSWGSDGRACSGPRSGWSGRRGSGWPRRRGR